VIPTLYSCSIDTYVFLERFRRYSTFLFGWDFPTGDEMFGLFGQNDSQNVKWEKNTGWEGTSVRQTASFEPLCVKLSLSVWPVQVGKEKGRKKSQEVCVSRNSRMCGATPSGWIPTKLGTSVRLTDVIKRAKIHQFYLKGFGAVRCWSFHVAIWTTRPMMTLLSATALQVMSMVRLQVDF